MENRKFRCNGVVLELSSRGKRRLTVCLPGGLTASIGVAAVGPFGEISAIEEKYRVHQSADLLEASCEAAAVIPFGCEYLVERELKFWDGFAKLTTDVSCRNPGVISELELESIEFSGDLAKVEIALVSGEVLTPALQDGVLFTGKEPPVSLLVTDKAGEEAEFRLIDDVWRYLRAGKLGGGEYTLRLQKDVLTLRRQVFAVAKDLLETNPPPRRPWRFTGLLAWSRPAASELTSPKEFVYPGCLLQPVNRRHFRSLLRKEAGELLLSGAKCELCSEANHLERRDKAEHLLHSDAGELAELWLWGNRRRLEKQDGGFAVAPAPGEKSLAIRNLSGVPGIMEEEE